MTATIGIEEELLIVGVESGDLVAGAPRLLEAARSELGELGEVVVSELNRCQIETNTTVVTDLGDAGAQLASLREGLVRAGEPLGLRTVPLASHPWSAWDDQVVNTDSAHYRSLLADYQQVARQQVICGCHVHVGVEDPDERVLAMGAVTPWLPVLLALSANSPWWQGSDTGYASYRTLVWKSWPTATMPPRVADHEALARLVEMLRAVEAVDDASALYWWVRPSSKLPTLEFRVADTCLRVEDALVVAGLARALTVTAIDERWEAALPLAVLDSALWRAARHGLGATLVDPERASLRPAAEVVRRLLDLVGPALEEAGDRQRVGDGVERLLGEGNGAELQRTVLSAGPVGHAEALAAIVTA